MIEDQRPIIVAPFGVATVGYNADTNELTFKNWRVVGEETNPQDCETYRAILEFLLARVTEHEDAAKSQTRP